MCIRDRTCTRLLFSAICAYIMEFRGMTCPFERITDVSIRSASLLPTITVCGPCMKAGISLGDAMETAASEFVFIGSCRSERLNPSSISFFCWARISSFVSGRDGSVWDSSVAVVLGLSLIHI